MPRKYLILLSVAGAVALADQWTKFLVVRELTPAMSGVSDLTGQLEVMYSSPPPEGLDGNHFRTKRMIVLSPSFFRIRYAENPESVRGPLFHIVSLGAVFLNAYYVRKLSGVDPAERWALWGLPLVLGGAIGNYIDRLARGYVVDFLEAHWYDRAAWPVFNLADSAICVGIGMLVLDAFLRREKKDSPATVGS